jgi:DNA-binding NtrC family response regulator
MEFLGLKVNAFCDTSQAIQFYKENSGNISFSIIDMSMPQLNGLELFQQIKSVNPNAWPSSAADSMKASPFLTLMIKTISISSKNPYNMKNLSAKLSEFCHKHNIIIN